MELTRFQKRMLAVLAGMLVFFGVLMAVFRAHPGVLFEGGLLKITETEGQTVYSGKANGDPVTITVSWPTNFETDVDFTIGDQFHDVCQVFYPTERIQTERGDSVGGILVTKNGKTLFEGGYDPEDAFGWYSKSGEWAPSSSLGIRGYTVANTWWGYETAAADAVRFAFGPETSAHGDPALFSMAVFLTALTALEIVFHRTLFRWRHWGAQDPEPTETWLALERAGWAVAAAVTAVVYIAALSEIY
ncbi:hypothetical protein [uncultured Oscillibacter sp.]|uniref:hypothetical protein n=1 Tax=uncultured Oscillibacter sp. TaxID=876091 RepID=UPI00262454D8|nr:hypothetical protein [uncultured Oscillibacter sp.]